MDVNKLEQAATAAGIAANYINAKGQSEAVSLITRQKLLAAMSTQARPAPAPLPACKVLRHNQPLEIGGSGKYQWHLSSETGQEWHGTIAAGAQLPLPTNLPHGYHPLLLVQGEKQWSCRIIIAPQRCYEPTALKQGQKLWGACVQLYTLRSAHNWGIGDFSDLKRMVSEVATRGGAFIGLNPIHALFPGMPENASPYSPSSRCWLNVLYIDVAALVDFRHSKAAQQWWQQPTTQQTLQTARDSDWVDYTRVAELKFSALRLAWQHFSQRETADAAQQQFAQFITLGGVSLFNQAAYDALHGVMLQEDVSRWGWPVWPETLQHRDNNAVQQFCQQNMQEVRFWMWLQWLAHCQFEACWQLSQQQAMPIGLYRDLAVGVAEGGAETWCDRELYCLKASVGAPPDNLGPLGQNWGLPPMDPHVMAARDYQPFIDLLRTNMASCGALRIDHVMSLLRLWWIPYGETANFGAYVAYPVDDLMAILALESERNQCMVIGEDLGIVPVEIISKLRDNGIYSWKVLYFEQENADSYRAPTAWPRQSIASGTTHDLPTLRGFWNAGDLALGEKLGLYPDKLVLSELYQGRARQKQALLNALHRFGCVPKNVGRQANRLAMNSMLNRGMQRFIADSNSALLGLQPEDWLDMAKPVNVPGTTDQYPNWRRKLSRSLDAMFADERVNRLIRELDKRRRKRADKHHIGK